MISGSPKKLRRRLKKFLESNANENTMYQNLWDARRVLLTWKFISRNVLIKKSEITKKQPNDEPQRLIPKLVKRKKY
jgi:hypothetical protein